MLLPVAASTQSSGSGTGDSTEKSGPGEMADMRIVLLGNRSVGKSSSGNTILGKKEFSTSGRTSDCVERKGETAGRRITAVEAPGWRNCTVKITPERDRKEIVHSVSLCPPGPHALLLNIRVIDSFTKTHRTAVQEHMELLGEKVWSHTIVLFTYGDRLGDTSIQQHIESGGEALQWVVEKCGNRYHVVDNQKSDGGQVTELLEKIEEMVAKNRDCFQFQESMEFPPEMGEHTPDEHSGSRSGNGSDLTSPVMLLPVAASTQSSGSGTGDSTEKSGSGEMAAGIQRTRAHVGNEIPQENVNFTPEHGKIHGTKEKGALYVFFFFSFPISDMRIVLLGSRTVGKSSSGNTILGKKEFSTSGRTAECVKNEGEIAGRRITVVEAPGWWRNYTVEQTPERDKREIVLSVSLCPPGPHALLLLIRVRDSFTETHRQTVQEHMELLGEKVWSHTIVLFTYGDRLGDTTIEQHIESGGEALQWVVEKCGNRYHVMTNKKSDGAQVTKLLDKIEEIVAGNKGHQYDFDRNISNRLHEKKKEEERRAEERKMEVQRQRQTLRSSAGGVPYISDIRIVLLGNRTTGKRSSGNTILGRKEFGSSEKTVDCVKRERETAARQITVVKAPGWLKNCAIEQTSEFEKQEIVRSVSLCPPGPHALLLNINVSDSFTETHRRAVQEHMELLGERVWSHTIVLFTRGDWLGDTSIEQHIESGGEALQWVVEKCGNRYHVLNNKKSDDGQVTELLEKIEEMVAKNRECFQFQESMEFPPETASTQSDGYGTGVSTEKSGPGEMAAVIQRPRSDNGDEIPQKNERNTTKIKGKLMYTADTLSRAVDPKEQADTKINEDVDAYVDMITSALPVADVKMELIKTETSKDETLKRLRKDYIVVTDYYSLYPEVCRLHTTTAEVVITSMKAIFSRHGVPSEVFSDNGPQFSNASFKNFAEEWNFVHTTSSPHYPQSNGLVEKSVQTVKRLLYKAKDSGADFYQRLLVYRTTPLECGMSPAQLLMRRRLRSNLHIQENLLKPKEGEKVKRFKEQQKAKQKFYYDRGTQNLPV
ncbi:GTPase IMAP family member 8-like [Alosa pseudoharengus]|uniref:GTPase IMAP family member 8-like n=1 Tax=Alosa pseudoharengus TaxID=34774 RepID=UPI003F8A3BE6